MITLRFTRLSPTHHRLDIVRPNGGRESVELETKSFLFHDLIHFAVETEARLGDSFFGKLAAGQTYAQVTAKGVPLSGEVLNTERVIGPLTGVVRGDVEVGAFQAGLENMFGALGEPVPGFVTDNFVTAVCERYRALVGQWKSTPFGQTMELKFQV
jgi:hypothetical protein